MQSPGWGVWLWLGGRRWKGGLLSQARPGQRWPVRRWPGSPVQGGQGGQVVPWSGPKKCIEKNLISGGEIDFESSYLLYDISSRYNYYDGPKNRKISFWSTTVCLQWNLYHKAAGQTPLPNTNRSGLMGKTLIKGYFASGILFNPKTVKSLIQGGIYSVKLCIYLFFLLLKTEKGGSCNNLERNILSSFCKFLRNMETITRLVISCKTPRYHWILSTTDIVMKIGAQLSGKSDVRSLMFLQSLDWKYCKVALPNDLMFHNF